MALTAGTRIGSYEVQSVLGEGGMGVVFRAFDTNLHRAVALKLLPDHFAEDADRLSRFQREARLLASLNHPNIAQIYGLEESNNMRCIVMELVEGETLEERLKRGPIAVEDTVAIAGQIADAVEAAHERGVIHRDLKPANIKLTPDGGVKVLDFGLARTMDGTPASPTMSNSPTMLSGTMGGVILGTAAYMSPEQARGKPVDKRTDIWAFGVIVWEMITGKSMFHGEDTSEVLAAVIRQEPDLEPIPTELRGLVERCLKKDPKQRMRDIGEARIALQSPPSSVSAPATGRLERRFATIPWVVSGLVALALIALVWIHFRETLPDERVLRASINLPDDFASLASFALSPDGRFLALALNGAGFRVLWLRALDSQRFQMLNETTGAQYPFWSPDNRSIGFFAAGKLKTIPARGGPPQTLCDLANDTSGGGSWSREGVILFSGGFGASAIQRVSEKGGACTAVTKPEARTNHRFPEFLPDGKHFLYFIDGGDQTKQGVYLASLDNPSDGRRILTDRSSAVFAPRSSKNRQDHILFLRDNTLMAQPFDATTLQTAGDAFAVTTQASFSSTGTTRQLAASVSGSGLLAYMANRTTDSQLNWIDRSGMDVEKVIARGPQRSVTLSPNGKTVVTGRPEGLWLRDLIRGVDSPFTFPPVNGQSSVWSFDGKWIAFSGGGSNGSTLFIKDVSGAGEPVAIFQNSNYKSVSDWSRDGRLLYTEIDPKTKADVWILPDPLRKTKDASPYKVLGSDFNETMAQFSPDGQWIAYVSDASGQYEVYIQQVSGAGKTKISSKRGTQPRWRSDGRELFYMETGPRYQWMAVAVQIGPGDTLTLGQPKVLFTREAFTNAPPANGFVYSPSADGQRFLVNTPSDALGTLNVITNWEKAASASKAPE